MIFMYKFIVKIDKGPKRAFYFDLMPIMGYAPMQQPLPID